MSSIAEMLQETVQGLEDIGLNTAFTEKDMKRLGVKPQKMEYSASAVRKIRKTLNVSQKVFSFLLNVSPSAVKQWEQGKKNPSGAVVAILDLLEHNPNALAYKLREYMEPDEQSIVDNKLTKY